MSARMISWVWFVVASVALLVTYRQPAPATPLGTAFTYQGQLQQSGIPAAGACDFQFDVFAAASGGSTLGTQTKSAVTVTNGLFTIPDMDFGSGPFAGEDRYLEIQVRCPAGGGSYTLLGPRQKLTATPYALYASTAGSVPWSSLTGVPAGFSDNVDNDTLGSLPCIEGQIPRRSAATWICGPDNNTTYSAGSGLTLTSTEFSVNTSVIQARVTGTCAAGSSIRVIDASGGVTCEPDDNSGGTVTSITAGTGLTGGTISDVGTIGVNFGSTAGTVAPGNHDHFGQSWSGGATTGLSVQNTLLNGNGIVGVANSGAAAFGVQGNAAAGRGVRGDSSTGIGVDGFSVSGFGMRGIESDISGITITSAGVLGDSAGAAGVVGTSSAGDGVFGQSSQTNGNGVHGQADMGVQAWGVFGESTTGVGVRGRNASGTGLYTQQAGVVGDSTTNPGVVGTSNGADGVYGVSALSGGYGVHGVANTGSGARALFGESTNGYGVYAFTTNGFDAAYAETARTNGNGVHGRANNGTNAWGVFGESTNGVGVRGISTSGLAGQFVGNVQVTGTLTKGGGSFKIDHPLDPLNKYLSHSFVESPDMMNIYNGNVTLDEKGEAWVELPAWFETLNQDFRYQLTAIGAPGPSLYVAEEVHDHRFKIAGGKAALKVSWQVTGIRHDPYAEANRIRVEEDKGLAERGTYLHPRAYGMPEPATPSSLLGAKGNQGS